MDASLNLRGGIHFVLLWILSELYQRMYSATASLNCSNVLKSASRP